MLGVSARNPSRGRAANGVLGGTGYLAVSRVAAAEDPSAARARGSGFPPVPCSAVSSDPTANPSPVGWWSASAAGSRS